MVTLEKIVQKLSFEKIVGQTLMGYVDEVKSFEELKRIVIDNALSGLIIGRKTMSSIKNPGAALRELASAYKKTFGFSLILAAEHEGGRCEWLPPPATELPSPMGIGATRDTKSAYLSGYITALELRTLSINANLAPVANLYPHGAGSEENSFGEDPDEVSDYVLSYIRGLRNGGVISFVKYFPSRSYEDNNTNEISRHDLKPFQMSFKSNVEGVIIGHAPLPVADSGNTPSSLSPKVVEKMVRREMGFKNIVITDYLDDEKIEFDPDEAAVRALRAGNHIAVPLRKMDGVKDVLSSIVEKASRDKDFYNKVRSGALEVLSFKLRKLEKFKKTPEKTRGSIMNQTKAWKIFLKSITIVKGVDELPLRWIGKPLVTITNGLNNLFEDADKRRLKEVLREEMGEFNTLEYVEEASSKRLSEIYRNYPSNTLLLILAYNTYSNKKETAVLKKLIEFFRENVVISFGSPKDLIFLSDAEICAAAFTPSLTAVKAALKVLKKRAEQSGKMPVKIEI